VEFKVGDAVLMSTKHLNLRLPGYKLAARYFDPFTVTALAGPNAVKLDLPQHQLGFQNHEVVNVSVLRPYYSRPERLRGGAFDRPARPLKPGSQQWVSDAVLAKRCRAGKDSQPEYLVVWQDCPLEEATWEPADNVPPWQRALLDNRHPADFAASDVETAPEQVGVQQERLPYAPEQAVTGQAGGAMDAVPNTAVASGVSTEAMDAAPNTAVASGVSTETGVEGVRRRRRGGATSAASPTVVRRSARLRAV